MNNSTGIQPVPEQDNYLHKRGGFATPWTRTGFQGVRSCETVLQERFDWR